MRHLDTVDKIVGIYLAAVCRRPFRYKGRDFLPRPLVVSPLLLRGHTCPPGCGACCGSFSLDFLPAEVGTSEAVERVVEVDGRRVALRSDRQSDVQDIWCRNLDRATGRCAIYERRPMACDFELIRFLIYETKVVLIQKQYGRAWAMRRLDGGRGAMCEMLPVSRPTIDEVIRKLERLEDWARHFGIETRIDRILDWIQAGDHSRPLRLSPSQ